MAKQYCIFSIGPIYNFISRSRSTREIWGASFLFSSLMRLLINKAEANGLKTIIPVIGGVQEDFPEVGNIPDIALFRSDVGISQSDIHQITASVMESLKSNIITGVPTMASIDESELESFLSARIRLEGISFEAENDNDAILKSRWLVETMDMRNTIPARLHGSYVEKLIADLIETDFCDSFKKSGGCRLFFGQRSIPTLEEIAEGTWGKTESKTEAERKQHKKYIAVIHADGDNLSAAIDECQNEQELRELSGKLTKFANEVVTLIRSHNGFPIYSAGDDLLAFAPVMCNEGGKNVFKLVAEIAEKYGENLGSKASISFGMCIGYYKHPMSELIEASRSELSLAKTSGKNCSRIRLIKHSGTVYNWSVYFSSSVSKGFLKDKFNLTGTQDAGSTFPSSVKWFLLENREVFKNALNKYKVDKWYPIIETLVLNTYEDGVHDSGSQSRFSEQLLQSLYFLGKEYENQVSELEKVITRFEYVFENVLSMLQMQHFVTIKSNDE